MSNCLKDPGLATAWFAALERARLTSDRKLEAKAVKNLRRLGIVVYFSVDEGEGDD